MAGDLILPIDVAEHDMKTLHNMILNAKLIIFDHSLVYLTSMYSPRDLVVHFYKVRPKTFYQDLLDTILGCNAILIYIQSFADIHNPAIADFEFFTQRIQAIAWLYQFKPTALSEIPQHEQDTWMNSHACPKKMWDIVNRNVESKFQMLHPLVESDFSLSGQYERRWDLAICGERYALRRQVSAQVSECHNLTIAPYRRNEWVIQASIRAFNTLKLPSKWVNQKFTDLRRWNQRQILAKSKLAFTCGSAYRYPVRRFFEIPAAGSVLIAHPFSGMTHCGFVSGENFIAIESVFDVRNEVEFLLKRTDLIKSIRNKCHKMLREIHMIEHRVFPLLTFVKAVAAGKKVQAEFMNGNFEVAIS